MIYSIIAKNYLGESVEMELAKPESSGFLVKSVTGAGPPQANVNITEVATIDGGVFNSSRAKTKNIVLQIIFWPKDNAETIEEIRHRSYKYFPLKQGLTLTFITDERTSYIVGYVEKNEPSIWDKQEGCQISIICDTPYLKSIKQDQTLFSGVRPMLFFPFYNNLVHYNETRSALQDNNLDNIKDNKMDDILGRVYTEESYNDRHIIMGEITKKYYYNVNYSGEVETGINILIHLTGPVDRIDIYNVTTNEHMIIYGDRIEAFTGTALKKRDEITICTVKGQRSANLLRAGKYINIFNCIDKDSDWFQLVKGMNQFAYTTPNDKDQADLVRFQIINDVLFLGI